MAKEKHRYKFKAEVTQVLDILTHSLYSNREIFLRELVSNASDALEKVHFEELKGTEIRDPKIALTIQIDIDADKKMISITDTGIGMTEQEIIKNIGTIARSGTADFLKRALKSKDDQDNIIGKFGVGFYSVFMVADQVNITSQSAEPEAAPVRWTSKGVGTFEVETLDKKIKRGTKIDIILKEDANDYADKSKLESIIRKHSNFIPFPIRIEKEQINKIRAIWREPKFQVKKKEYEEFYKFLTYDSDAPLATIHVSIDAPVQYNSLMFIPAKNYEFMNFGKNDHGLDLYVKRVLIQHENKDLLPEYLRFIRGVVDSEDIPLNISRETLQENLIISKISNNLITQVYSYLQKLAKDEAENYRNYWNEFGRQFKLGYTDYAHQEKFADLLRFDSSFFTQENELTSLEEYVTRFKPDQKEIYYYFAQNRDAMASNPYLEIFKKKGIEVIYLYDPIDEFVMEGLRKYKEYDVKSVEHSDLSALEKFSDQEAKGDVDELEEEDKKVFDKLLRRMKDVLGDKVSDVKASQRLTESPTCLVSADGTMTSGMQKIMQIMNKDASIPQKIMEVNPDHPMIRDLLKIYKKDVNDPHLSQVTEQLFESNLLLEGYLTDAHKMVHRIEKLLQNSTAWYVEKQQG